MEKEVSVNERHVPPIAKQPPAKLIPRLNVEVAVLVIFKTPTVPVADTIKFVVDAKFRILNDVVVAPNATTKLLVVALRAVRFCNVVEAKNVFWPEYTLFEYVLAIVDEPFAQKLADDVEKKFLTVIQ